MRLMPLSTLKLHLNLTRGRLFERMMTPFTSARLYTVRTNITLLCGCPTDFYLYSSLIIIFFCFHSREKKIMLYTAHKEIELICILALQCYYLLYFIDIANEYAGMMRIFLGYASLFAQAKMVLFSTLISAPPIVSIHIFMLEKISISDRFCQ